MCFRKRRKKERVRSAEGRRRLCNSPFSSLRASSPGRSGGGEGKGNSNPYPKPLPPYPAPPPERPVELARKQTVLVPNVKKAMGTWLYFLPTSFPGFWKPWEYPLWPVFFCVFLFCSSWYEKGLLNFVTDRKKLLSGLTILALPFKLVKPQFIGRILQN